MSRLALLLLLVACASEPSGPAGIDPTVLVTNRTSWPVYFTWRDGQGIVGADTIRAGVTRCEQFFARADSAYWQLFVGDSLHTPPGYAAMQTNWFHPTAREYWTADVSGPQFVIIMRDVATVPC